MKQFFGRLLSGYDTKQLLLTVTLLYFMLHISVYRYVQVPVTLLCLMALIFPLLWDSKWIWGAIIVVYVLGSMPHYFELINHKFLYLYWAIAIFACLFSKSFEQDIAFNARVLLVLVFAIAGLQKLFSADYRDGSFMLYILSKDQRIAGFLNLLHLLPKEMLQQNIAAVNHIVQQPLQPQEAAIVYTPAVKQLAAILTWLTVAVELLIAVLFSLPEKIYAARYRHLLLLLFLFFTYMLAPIAGFGSILAIMGIALAGSKKTALWYIFMFFLIQVYGLQLHQLAAFFSKLF
ncbi:MAG TPA: hypothetical protein PKC39_13270 [Ferruginibacter sp.]|nr:hypothetical protein [Ferruginibacter sp.]HMP21924.1 hypothetical protein [Ferruginibacter sp.]